MNDIWELPEVESVAIVGNPKKYSPKLIESLAAKKVTWFTSQSEVPKDLKKSMVITEPGIFDYLFKRAEPNLEMKSKLHREWSDDFKFIFQVSSRHIGFRHH